MFPCKFHFLALKDKKKGSLSSLEASERFGVGSNDNKALCLGCTSMLNDQATLTSNARDGTSKHRTLGSSEKDEEK